ncbi:MAG: hypothetical protein ACKO6B_07330 [Planctomycetia bacterium]
MPTSLRRGTMLWGGLAVFVGFAAGCGRTTGQVSIGGDVSYDGQPVASGTIIFTPVEGTQGPATGAGIEDGRYRVPAQKGPVVGGRYKVEITALRKTGRTVPNTFDPNGQPLKLSEQFVPDHYNTRSTLVVTVNPGANKADFALSSVAK